MNLSRAQTVSTAFDVSLRPARAAQIVYTLTSIPAVKRVVIKVNGLDRARFVGSKLALKGSLDKHDLSKPITLSARPNQVPKGHVPADPRGVQKRLVSLGYLPAHAVSGAWNAGPPTLYSPSRPGSNSSAATGSSARRRWPHSRTRHGPGP